MSDPERTPITPSAYPSAGGGNSAGPGASGNVSNGSTSGAPSSGTVIDLTRSRTPHRARSAPPPPPSHRSPMKAPAEATPRRESSTRGLRDSSPGPDSGGFSARLEGATLADLVQMECIRGLTRAFQISSGGRTGRLFFGGGQIIHAEAGRLRGDEAALEILAWSTGTIEPHPADWSHPATIQSSWQGMLMRAMQRLDEANQAPSPADPSQPDPSQTMESSSEEGETLEPGVTRAVRLASDGAVLGQVGDAEHLVEAAAYAFRLAELMGEGLGLEGFRGLEVKLESSIAIAYREKGTVVMLEAEPDTRLDKYRGRAGT